MWLFVEEGGGSGGGDEGGGGEGYRLILRQFSQISWTSREERRNSHWMTSDTENLALGSPARRKRGLPHPAFTLFSAILSPYLEVVTLGSCGYIVSTRIINH